MGGKQAVKWTLRLRDLRRTSQRGIPEIFPRQTLHCSVAAVMREVYMTVKLHTGFIQGP